MAGTINQGAFIQAARQSMRNALHDILKELYLDETWAIKEFKAGRFTDLEVELYRNEINAYAERQKSFKNLIYHENPLLTRIKQP